MDYQQLEKNLRYRFKDSALILTALCHRSYVNEHPDVGIENNERLEFLGDAVLNLVAGDLIMRRHPEYKEGELSRMRAALVNESRLADVARAIDLGRHLLLGKGEIQTNGRDKNSILADAMEAVIAAVYLDSGFNAAFELVEHHLAEPLRQVSAAPRIIDFKSRLQEWVQTSHNTPPRYNVVDESGPDHDKTFTVELRVMDIVARGTGKNKKTAEQAAARECLQRLSVDV